VTTLAPSWRALVKYSWKCTPAATHRFGSHVAEAPDGHARHVGGAQIRRQIQPEDAVCIRQVAGL